ncbi:shikimate dehydrogenase [Sporolactobacillus shoreicorticis]|uniref:Shikimate dehydrogenase (NADP(+)) n=1 Tax=Sporolactobacillus shoreicorticis TaxID=1923877 RepID=A0ABW5S4Z9_9BACL|nr:shikimate dehydrogenase [Sporolactobacillus shoreicorticis]MCO7126362.1 shikimate dehydrogenase [Sporolactobacillus shoreicorticis]
MDDLYGLIGAPVAHSLSPAMHNYWFKQYGISAQYRTYLVDRQHLNHAVSRLKESGIKGFNVTYPLKTEILPLLDSVDETAQEIGAVNTVVCSNGRLIGYNTDGAGFLEGLKQHFPELTGKYPSILIIGAGGAARSVALTLARVIGTRVDIANRTFEKAVKLSTACRMYAQSEPLTFRQAEVQLDRYKMVINTTPIGFDIQEKSAFIHLYGARTDTLFADLIYQPRRTVFLKEAEQRGYFVMNGLPMLVYQGALAFAKWNGFVPDTRKMEEHLIHMYLD